MPITYVWQVVGEEPTQPKVTHSPTDTFLFQGDTPGVYTIIVTVTYGDADNSVEVNASKTIRLVEDAEEPADDRFILYLPLVSNNSRN